MPGPRIQSGVNDFPTLFPLVVEEWNSVLNSPVLPTEIGPGSDKVFWWTCQLGHDYQAPVKSKCGKGMKCPICSNKRVLVGFNDLDSRSPEIAKTWHPSRNGNLTPKDVAFSTSKRFWWTCLSGHEWEASAETRQRSGCPFCANRRVNQGDNDFATNFPLIAREWHPTKNGKILPSQITPGSSKKYWWLCDEGHDWQASPGKRRSQGCPYCSNNSLWVGFNDLASREPHLAKQWNSAKNVGKSAKDVKAVSPSKAWWLCDFGHEWEASISARVSGNGCPVCANKVIHPGENDLATKNPQVAKEWHPTKNGKQKASEIAPGAKTLAFWLCPLGHEYQVQVAARTGSRAAGCPYCANYRVLAGFNDLETRNPLAAAEWHPTKNGTLKPNEVVAGSSAKYWWMCSEGHEWKTTANSRLSGVGCGACAQSGFAPGLPALLYFISSKELRARKIGITNTGLKSDRLATFSKLGWSVLATFESPNGYEVLEAETALFRWLRKDLKLPIFLTPQDMPRTGGASETFSEDGPSDLEVETKIREVLKLISEKRKLD